MLRFREKPHLMKVQFSRGRDQGPRFRLGLKLVLVVGIGDSFGGIGLSAFRSAPPLGPGTAVERDW